MEDTHFLARDGSFVGVFDGHAGAGVSAYAKKHLHARFSQLWSDSCCEKGDRSVKCVAKSLRKAFVDTDKEIQSDDALAQQGSTATVVVVPHLLRPTATHSNGKKQYVTANLGDSRAVLCRKWKAIDLTKDHKPNAPRERLRVVSQGGTVDWYGYRDTDGKPLEGTGVWRINGNLAVARAFGDRYARPFVSGECEIKCFDCNEKEDQFIIVASDGLWDVMSSREAVKYVQSMMAGSVGALPEGGVAQGNRPSDVDLRTWQAQYSEDRGLVRAALQSRKKKMAKYLVEEALRRGTYDNITVAILWLK